MAELAEVLLLPPPDNVRHLLEVRPLVIKGCWGITHLRDIALRVPDFLPPVEQGLELDEGLFVSGRDDGLSRVLLPQRLDDPVHLVPTTQLDGNVLESLIPRLSSCAEVVQEPLLDLSMDLGCEQDIYALHLTDSREIGKFDVEGYVHSCRWIHLDLRVGV